MSIQLDISPDTRTEGAEDRKWFIVGFSVTPRSLARTMGPAVSIVAGDILTECGQDSMLPPLVLSTTNPTTVVYTYDVTFVPSTVLWEHRWDTILASKPSEDQMHWFTIIKSMFLLLLLTGGWAVLMVRILHRYVLSYEVVPLILRL